MPESIESNIHAAITAGKINGAVLCATNAEGTFTYNKALGERTLLSGEKVPQKLDDVIYLASATKIVTTIAALQCVEDGLLSLTGDISEFAPELAAKEIITGFTSDDEPVLEPATRPITLAMLLTHSSGVVYDFMNPLLVKWREKFDPPENTNRRSVEEAFQYPLAMQPGSGWMYGPGLDWAGRIIERVTGGTLGEYMHRRIFSALGISDAQFNPVTRDDLRRRMVDLNPQDSGGLGRAVTGGYAEHNKRNSGDQGGSGLFMTGVDFSKISYSLLADDGKLLKSSTIEDMFQHRLDEEANTGFQDALKGPWGKFFRCGIDNETKIGHGLGGVLTFEDA